MSQKEKKQLSVSETPKQKALNLLCNAMAITPKSCRGQKIKQALDIIMKESL